MQGGVKVYPIEVNNYDEINNAQLKEKQRKKKKEAHK